jgi:hypothetical protein
MDEIKNIIVARINNETSLLAIYYKDGRFSTPSNIDMATAKEHVEKTYPGVEYQIIDLAIGW